MSSEAACIIFPSGEVFFTGYHGCSSAVNHIIFDNKDQLFIDAFADPEEENFRDLAESYEDVEEFERARAARTYEDIVDVEIFTPYAGGTLWKARASLSAKVIVSGFSNVNADTVVDYQLASDWPDWVKELGIPATRSLLVEEWLKLKAHD